MITTLTVNSSFLTRYAYQEQHGENVTIGLDNRADAAIHWVMARMEEQARIADLAEKNPSVADAVLAVTSVLPAKPRMRDLIHDKWLMMTGITEFVEEGQSRHPCYRMYKHDHPFYDGVNAWV